MIHTRVQDHGPRLFVGSAYNPPGTDLVRSLERAERIDAEIGRVFDALEQASVRASDDPDGDLWALSMQERAAAAAAIHDLLRAKTLLR
jgi:hypothetical protein